MRLVKITKRAPIQLLVPFRVIHYNFVNIELEGYRTKRVGFIGDGASKLLILLPF